MNPELSYCRPLLLLNQIKHSKRGQTAVGKASLQHVLVFGAVEDSNCRFIFSCFWCFLAELSTDAALCKKIFLVCIKIFLVCSAPVAVGALGLQRLKVYRFAVHEALKVYRFAVHEVLKVYRFAVVLTP